MTEKLSSMNFNELENLGLINSVAVRNLKINARFDELKLKGFTNEDIEYMLAEEFFLSPESIHRIRYTKRSRKNST